MDRVEVLEDYARLLEAALRQEAPSRADLVEAAKAAGAARAQDKGD